MKLINITLENYRSFRDRQTFQVDGDISIIIGPNGGGKSNLLDVTSLLLKKHVLKPWSITDIDPPNPYKYQIYRNEHDLGHQLRKHLDAPNEAQFAEITLEVTEQDLKSMQYIIEHETKFRELLLTKYTGAYLPDIAKWESEMPIIGQTIKINIPPTPTTDKCTQCAENFLDYLANYEWLAHIKSQLDADVLSTPLLLLPANRSANGLAFDVGLSEWQENDFKTSVDFGNSRTAANIVQLAVGRLANRYNDLLHDSNGGANEAFSKSEEAKRLTSSLASLGYDWKMSCRNRKNNTYTIELSKEGRTLSINEVSSGEKEILVLLFAIFGLNVRQAVVIIDEPELHLHPRLQKRIFSLLEKLSKETGNQFILATHSPTFVSPSTIQYVSRVYSENATSKITRLNESSLPNAKHLFNIINSQNNESLFFADHVLLVEGLSDKIFFEKVLEYFLKRHSTNLSIEVVPVGGKGLFNAYRLVLEACKIPHSLIADQDYLQQIGSESVKRIFSLDSAAVKKHVIKDSTSLDGATLVAHIEKAMKDGCWGEAINSWEYIKSRHTHLPSEFTPDQNNQIITFIEEKRSEGIYILSLGSLEMYLPPGHLSKDIEKLISLLERDDYFNALPEGSREEITTIMTHLIKNLLTP
ncbi:ATP-dependent nuclease [Pseudomonas putida]